MANVTEQDIIDHLREKIKFHQKEAKRIENLLSAFVSDTNTQRGRKAKLEAVDEAIETEPAPTQNTKAGRKSKTTDLEETVQPLPIPEKYTDDMPVTAKIAFALNEIGTGFNEDIANTMAQYEPKSDAKKISRQIMGALADLKSSGQLKTEKVGRKEKFSLAV